MLLIAKRRPAFSSGSFQEGPTIRITTERDFGSTHRGIIVRDGPRWLWDLDRAVKWLLDDLERLQRKAAV